MRWTSPLLLAAGARIGATSDPAFENACSNVASRINANGTTVKFVEYLSADSAVITNGLNATCSASPATAVDICRVAVNITTSPSSSVVMEAWLPRNWTGRLLHTGNSGTDGCIDYGQFAYGTSLGFATVGHNNGHNGTSGGAFNNQPEVLTDFSWRAMVTGTTVGKNITHTFYNSSADSKSYHLGCSTGGRQGFRAAQSHPDLFDGIVAAAPVLNSDGMISFWADGLVTLGLGNSSSDAYITPESWQYVGNEVMKQCDALDGATDGILENTRACDFNSSTLLCSVNNNTGCLTSAQVCAFDGVFAPYVVDGQEIFPGYDHGGDALIGAGLALGAPLNFVLDWFRYVVYSDPAWQVSQFTSANALKVAQANFGDMHTFKTDLSAFRDAGGKIIHWHGQADQLASVRNSDLYYDLTLSDTADNSTEKLDEFYRYFRISGTQHCAGGPGANSIGQFALGSQTDPEDNVLLALVEWVENGAAPESIRGTKYVNDDPSQGVSFTRKHCKEPLVNVYTGTNANGTDEAGWHCVQK